MTKTLEKSQSEYRTRSENRLQQFSRGRNRKILETMLLLISVMGYLLVCYFGLVLTPPDVHLGQTVRILYIHPATAWVALYLCFGLGTLCSLLYLIPKTRSVFFDRLGATFIELGTVFLSLTTIVGSIWGYITWGVWWTWDALLTSTAILIVLYLGYLTIRQIPASKEKRAKRSAVFALIAALDLPVVQFAVDWWNTLHQTSIINFPKLSFTVQGSMLGTLVLSFAVLTIFFIWLALVKYDVLKLQSEIDEIRLQALLAERIKGAN